MDKWEYSFKRLSGHFWASEGRANDDFIAELQKLGAEGWELVTLKSQADFSAINVTRWTECLFKRRVG